MTDHNFYLHDAVHILRSNGTTEHADACEWAVAELEKMRGLIARASEEPMPTERQIASLNNVTEIQCTDGNWNYDAYMQGMANGLILARAIINGGEPEFLEAPPQWLAARPNSSSRPTEHLTVVSGGKDTAAAQSDQRTSSDRKAD